MMANQSRRGLPVSPNRIVWTNKSVLRFAGNTDPVEAIEAKARELVLRARDAGWAGPPYNPLAIADLLGIPVEANSDVIDRIEFNPIRPRERVRFSIAHEIAHTLFEDVAEKTRHRSGPTSSRDDWQLETLCNIAAAEFVMPLGSLPASEHLPKIEQLVLDRLKFDVSAEAFLIRAVKTTAEPALMFCASALEQTTARAQYCVDYSVASKSAPAVAIEGRYIPIGSVAYACTAIGQTVHAMENWISESALRVECVGIPAFAGATYPRIGGIVRFRNEDAEQDSLNIVHGDVLAPAGAGPKIVCQLVNDQAKVWGGGVARASAQRYPEAQEQFARWISQVPKRERLGRVHFVDVSHELTIASLVAQEGYGASKSPRIRYSPLKQAFADVVQFALDHKATVHMPRIGSGQSGGTWDTVEEIIRDTVIARGVPVTVYDLPPRRQRGGAELFI
jgi:O-acetyl-ADP-ribose deacetylase (regulator of RNase III)